MKYTLIVLVVDDHGVVLNLSTEGLPIGAECVRLGGVGVGFFVNEQEQQVAREALRLHPELEQIANAFLLEMLFLFTNI